VIPKYAHQCTRLFSTVNNLSDNFPKHFDASELYNILTSKFGNMSIHSKIKPSKINYSERTIYYCYVTRLQKGGRRRM